MARDVRFGSAFAVDQLGFVGKGTIAIDDGGVTLTGKKHWPTGYRIAVFLAITVLPLVLFKIGLGVILALVVVHYACVSDATLSIRHADVSGVTRKKRKITFNAAIDGSKAKRSLFSAKDENEAAEIEAALRA